MAKGTALTVAHDATNRDIALVVYNHYSEKINSEAGWYGTAVVRMKPAPDAGDDAETKTYLVKRTNAGMEIFERVDVRPINISATIG